MSQSPHSTEADSESEAQADSDAQSDGQQHEREPARRVFPAALNRATITFKESDADRAPQYALLPTGVRANRVVIGAALAEVTDVGSEKEYLQTRLIDFAGDAVYTYTGQYQEAALEFLRQAEPPMNVMLVGKPRIFEDDDGEIYVSVRPERFCDVSLDQRRRWTLECARHTAARIERFQNHDEGYVDLARDRYGDLTQVIAEAAEENLRGLRRTMES